MLQPQLIDKPALTVVGLETSFIHALSPDANNLRVIGELWQRFTQQALLVHNRIGDEMYGIVHGRPASERKHPDELQYLAAVRVNDATEPPAGMAAKTIPAGIFAVFTHHGPINKIGETCDRIYRVWLPASAFKHTGGPDVELYDHRFCPDSAESEMEYWVSVTPK